MLFETAFLQYEDLSLTKEKYSFSPINILIIPKMKKITANKCKDIQQLLISIYWLK